MERKKNLCGKERKKLCGKERKKKLCGKLGPGNEDDSECSRMSEREKKENIWQSTRMMIRTE